MLRRCESRLMSPGLALVEEASEPRPKEQELSVVLVAEWISHGTTLVIELPSVRSIRRVPALPKYIVSRYDLGYS